MTSLDLQASFIQTLTAWGLSPEIAKVIWMPLPMVLMIAAATLLALVATWLERKISAAAQQRIGPEYIGPAGILVPIADVLKLILKESVIPNRVDRILFTIAPLLVFIPVFLS